MVQTINERIVVAPNDRNPHALANVAELIEPVREWRKPAPRFILNAPDAVIARITRSPRVVRYMFLLEFRDAMVLGSDCILTRGEIVVPVASARYRLTGIATGGAPYIKRCLDLELEGGRFSIAAPRDVLHLPGRVLGALSEEPENWGLWLLYRLPAALHFIDHRGRYDRFLAYAAHPNMRELLDLVGIGAEALVAHQVHRPLRVDALSVFRHAARDRYISPHDREGFARVRDLAVAGGPPGVGALVFLSRRSRTESSGFYRGLLNEAELIEALSARGFAIIEPELLSARAQIAAMAGARLVVGLGGAACSILCSAVPARG